MSFRSVEKLGGARTNLAGHNAFLWGLSQPFPAGAGVLPEVHSGNRNSAPSSFRISLPQAIGNVTRRGDRPERGDRCRRAAAGTPCTKNSTRQPRSSAWPGIASCNATRGAVTGSRSSLATMRCRSAGAVYGAWQPGRILPARLSGRVSAGETADRPRVPWAGFRRWEGRAAVRSRTAVPTSAEARVACTNSRWLGRCPAWSAPGSRINVMGRVAVGCVMLGIPCGPSGWRSPRLSRG